MGARAPAARVPPPQPGDIPAVARILSGALWLGIVGQFLLYLSASSTIDVDVFHGMALFREALLQGRIPRADVFAYTPTIYPVVHHEWGTGAVLYALWQGAGWGTAGINALRYVLVAAVVACAWWCTRQRGASTGAMVFAAPLAIFLVTIAFYSALRGQAFTLVFFAILLAFLEADRAGGRAWIPLWLLAHVAWLNLHGGFVVGFGVIAATVVERFTRARLRGAGTVTAGRTVAHLLFTLAAMALLVVVNPWGVDYVAYLLKAIPMKRPAIVEWAPLWDGRMSSLFVLVYVGSLILLAGAIWRVGSRAAVDVSGWGVLLALAFPALLSVRHLSLYALAWFVYVAPLLARAQTAWVDQARRAPAWRIWAAAVSLAIFLLGAWVAVERRAWELAVPDVPQRGGNWYPVRAVDHLANIGFTGRLATRFADGSYVTWRLHPNVRVSFDSRYEAAYLPGAYEEHEALFAAMPGWRTTLDRDGADAVLVPRASPLTAALDARPDEWKRAYRDEVDSVYLRDRRLAPHRLPGERRSVNEGHCNTPSDSDRAKGYPGPPP